MYVEVIDMKQDKEQNNKSSCTLKINGIQYNQTSRKGIKNYKNPQRRYDVRDSESKGNHMHCNL